MASPPNEGTLVCPRLSSDDCLPPEWSLRPLHAPGPLSFLRCRLLKTLLPLQVKVRLGEAVAATTCRARDWLL